MSETVRDRVNCFKCAHLSISWDPRYPKTCGLFGFKSMGMPSLMVYKSTGEECAGFEPKRK